MASWVIRCLAGCVILMLAGCAGYHENELAKQQEWEQLGEYHGGQGYREWSNNDLNKHGALSETDYEKYRAGYLQGRFEYCSGRNNVNTVLNPAYPDECNDNRSSYGLVERGY
ncbi:hypothetical protein C9I98_22865 [Photobacterium sanctipauli]|uniref:DUF2799 domain-containing protein n=1 Tax=Photobacterium sanctipauli TaxID=1342794 RepID=A0A2T3NDY6_9GAMM|nr:DUF2799 domain-containing protein [Photobacterium sanctipauli]PSW12580.1 hypothetical protein C9I98_22865 [Photobacterium sanctipauli]